ncbi:hypothetical protein SCLARK_00642 [Spiroplasma clarkii]|uniref:Transmembrane protein n=2 Tax=Spiroplasma clarkii TaxID=2139 RepID=A0A1Y0L0N1_9MOLU|nr:hypothetical protein SCLARK_00642 [Spiroplasma clarkii]ATX70734.1 hypothetical protein SCLAR_v1c04100 [Spiroplasma clarkii]
MKVRKESKINTNSSNNFYCVQVVLNLIIWNLFSFFKVFSKTKKFMTLLIIFAVNLILLNFIDLLKWFPRVNLKSAQVVIFWLAQYDFKLSILLEFSVMTVIHNMLLLNIILVTGLFLFFMALTYVRISIVTFIWQSNSPVLIIKKKVKLLFLFLQNQITSLFLKISYKLFRIFRRLNNALKFEVSFRKKLALLTIKKGDEIPELFSF